MKIGILGGTFDPIHQGHLTLARAAQKQFGLDKVLFVPVFIPPHKSSRRDIVPAPYRYRMVELAIRHEPDFEISHAELDRPDISYTIDTLMTLKKLHSKDELFLILGSDAFLEFASWREPQEIRKLVHFLIAPRKEEDLKKGKIRLPFEDGVSWVQMPICPISSSDIREKIRRGELLSGLLPATVEDYVRRMNLYQEGRSCPSS